MKKSRYKLLISNIIIYGFNQAIIALIPVIMLPIYSRILPDITVYGISSLTSTISTLATSLATFGMFDAAVRFAFDKTDNIEKQHKTITSTATIFMLICSVLLYLIMSVLKRSISVIFFGTSKYTFMVTLASFMAIFNVLNTAALIPIRIHNKRKIAILNSLIKVVMTAFFTLVLIYLKKYLIAIPLGTMLGLAVSWFITFFFYTKNYFSVRYFDKNKCIDMLKYAAPLMITFISYWIYQSSDKIMLSAFSSLKEVGIYTIGAKISAISAIIQNAFASGWAYFAFSTMDDKDQINMISKIFRISLVICCSISIFILITILPLFKLTFASGDYILGANLCAALFISPLYLTLMQIIGTQLLIKKNTKTYSSIQIVGSFINIICNLILIPYFGSRGAAVGTQIGYIVPLTFLMAILINRKKIYVKKSTLLIFISTSLSICLTTLFVYSKKINMMIGITNIILIVILEKDDIKLIMKKSVDFIKQKRGRLK